MNCPDKSWRSKKTSQRRTYQSGEVVGTRGENCRGALLPERSSCWNRTHNRRPDGTLVFTATPVSYVTDWNTYSPLGYLYSPPLAANTGQQGTVWQPAWVASSCLHSVKLQTRRGWFSADSSQMGERPNNHYFSVINFGDLQKSNVKKLQSVSRSFDAVPDEAQGKRSVRFLQAALLSHSHTRRAVRRAERVTQRTSRGHVIARWARCQWKKGLFHMAGRRDGSLAKLLRVTE